MRRAIAALLMPAMALAASQSASRVPEPLKDVSIDQRLNERLPLDLVFRDETGRAVPLKTYFGRQPVVLALVYYDCPMLCTLVLNGLLRAMRGINLNLGTDYQVVAVSFDPRETPTLAAAKKQFYVEKYAHPQASSGWHFLTGDAASIRGLTQAAGFHYRWDEKSKQFAHASGIMVATREGRLARYFYGIEYPARDFRLALVEASENRIGSAVDQILLYCFHYDSSAGRYTLAVLNIIRVFGLATLAGLILFVLLSLRSERRTAARLPDDPGAATRIISRPGREAVRRPFDG